MPQQPNTGRSGNNSSIAADSGCERHLRAGTPVLADTPDLSETPMAATRGAPTNVEYTLAGSPSDKRPIGVGTAAHWHAAHRREYMRAKQPRVLRRLIGVQPADEPGYTRRGAGRSQCAVRPRSSR